VGDACVVDEHVKSTQLVLDLTLEQILGMFAAIAKIQGDPDYLEPMFQTTLDGVRAPAGSSGS
jgi:hypothetical protein